MISSGGDGNDTIISSGTDVLLNGGAGDDYITNEGVRSLIRGGTGNDTILNRSDATSVTVESGEGNDLIDNAAAEVTISTGTGADSVVNTGSNVTINGGEGNDYIILGEESKNNLIQYTSGDGKDLVTGFNATSSLQIGDGTASYATVKSGSDIIVTVGDGSITLVGAADLETVNIVGKLGTSSGSDTQTGGDTDGKVIINTNASSLLTGTSYDDTIYNYASKVSIKGGDGGDLLTTLRKTANVKIYGEAGNDTLEAYNATKALLSGGADDDYIYMSGGSGNTAFGGAGNDTIELDSASAQILYTSGNGNDLIDGFNETSTLKIGNGTGTYSTLDGGSDDVILTVGDGKITLRGVGEFEDIKDQIQGTLADKLLTLDDNSTWQQTLEANIEIVDASTRTKSLQIKGNGPDNTILGGNGRNTIWGGAGEDVFIYTGGKDVITDYTAGEDVISLATATFSDISKATTSGANAYISLSAGNYISIIGGQYKELTLVDATGTENTMIIGGEKYTDESKWQQTLQTATEFATATERTKSIQITGNASDNTILGGTGRNTIWGGTGDDYIRGGTNNDSLLGEAGHDTLDGGKGNDTLLGGAGEDVFIYTGGKDVITDYTSGEDMISIGAAKGDISWKDSGTSDVLLTVGKAGTLLLKGVRNSGWLAYDSNGDTIGINDTLTVTNADGWDVKIADTNYRVIDATARTKVDKLTGNDHNNKILGGSAKDIINGAEGDDYLVGNGNDTLWGGAGNDSLWGDDGADTFVYANGDGKDIIFDFDADDLLQITGTFTGTYNIGTNTIAIKVGSTADAITLQDFTANTFNINGDSYRISGTKLVKK